MTPPPEFPAAPPFATDEYRWELCVRGAMKAMNLDDPSAAQFYATVLYQSDIPTRDPDGSGLTPEELNGDAPPAA